MTEQQMTTMTTMYDVLNTLEALIKAAPKAERDALAAVLDAYAESFPDDFFWAVGAQSPTLLYHLLSTIDTAASDDGKRRRVMRLITREPEGNA